MPSTKIGVLSGVMLGSLIFSVSFAFFFARTSAIANHYATKSQAALGGKLVYDYSIGVQRMGAGVEERKLMFTDNNKKAQ